MVRNVNCDLRFKIGCTILHALRSISSLIFSVKNIVYKVQSLYFFCVWVLQAVKFKNQVVTALDSLAVCQGFNNLSNNPHFFLLEAILRSYLLLKRYKSVAAEGGNVIKLKISKLLQPVILANRELKQPRQQRRRKHHLNLPFFKIQGSYSLSQMMPIFFGV